MKKSDKNHFFSENGVFIIAEAGGNHEGDFEYAKRLARLASESGADAVKFQIYSGDSLVNPLMDPERNRHFKRFQLKKQQYIELARLCKRLKTSFMASVWDKSAIGYINKYMRIYKIGSGDLTAYSLIKDIVATGKPIILSTGLSTMKEVSEAVNFIKGLDSSYIREKKLALLQCTSMYPAADSEANLSAMLALKEKFGLPAGYSGHTLGTDAAEVAAAMGADIIEVHFTDSRKNKTFRDHAISFTPAEIRNLIKRIRRIKCLQGSFNKRPAFSELKPGYAASFRRAVYPKKNLKAGAVIKEKDLVVLRPNIGIDARDFYEVAGKRLKKAVIKYQKLDMKMFE